MSDREDENSGSEDETLEEDEIYNGKKNVAIIVIDVGPSMFEEPRTFKECLLAVYQNMERMLVKSFRRNIAVCFLRDEDIVFTGLNDNITDSTKKIYELLKKPKNELKDMFERNKPVSIRYALTECIKQLRNLEKVNPYIVILTNDEDPVKGDKNEKLSAIDVALSLKEMHIKLIVLPLKSNFNYQSFYSELLEAANEVSDINYDGYAYESSDSLCDILDLIIKDKINIKRYKFRLFEKSDKLISFWIQLRYLVTTEHLNVNCSISRVNKNKVKQSYRDENEIDPDVLIVKRKDLSKPLFKLNKNHNFYLKMPFGFRLLYVSLEKQSSIHYLNKTGFILQNDEIENDKSQNLFNYLWDYCKNKNRYLVCGFNVPGNRQKPKLVELSPNTFQSKPCFVGQFLTNYENVVELPDDLFNEYDKTKIEQNDPQLGLVFDMIDKLMLSKFDLKNFTDYTYDVKAIQIKEQLLDIELEPVDFSLHTDEEVTERLGDTNTELLDTFGIAVQAPPSKKMKKST